MNKQFQLSNGLMSSTPMLTENEVILCTTVLQGPHFQERFRDKWILIDGFAKNDVEMFLGYGFKKVITLMELMSLETSASPWIGLDYQEGWNVKLKVLATRNRVLKRYGMSMEELRAQLKFSAIITSCHSYKVLSFLQIACDILSTKDGSLNGEPLGPNDPQVVTVITTNYDLLYASNHPSPRHGPRVLEIALEAVYRETTGRNLEIERYGKPFHLNY